MCLQCWDADKMAEKINAGDTSCTGIDMPKMSLEELKLKIFEEWQTTRKTNFEVFHKAVPSAPSKTLSWTLKSPIDKSEAKINIKFI